MNDQFELVPVENEPEYSIPELSSGICVVIGDGPNWHLPPLLKGNFDVIAANRAIYKYRGYVKYWASWHSTDDIEFRCMVGKRTNEGLNFPERSFSWCVSREAEHYTMSDMHGGSGLYGVLVSLNVLQYKKVIVCNCPLTDDYELFHPGWIAAKETLQNRVKAIDGFPAKLLGKPDQEWVDS